MSSAEQIVLWFYGWIVAVWVVRHIGYTFIARGFDVLTPRSPLYTGGTPPFVSIIIPAKDEEATLAECLSSVCAQSYPALEILVVDDRSTDGTGRIAAQFAATDPRIRVITIKELPAGWIGKTHALDIATKEARGEWYWFLDSDTRHHADALSIVLAYAQRNNASLATLMPELRCETFWEKVLQPLEGIVLMRSFAPRDVNNDHSKIGFANGQFLLIAREAYDAVGGHAAVRHRFVEDIYMAQNVKNSGRPIRLAIGTTISSTRMYTSLPQIVRGWSRILFDALGRKAWPLVWKIVEPLIFSQVGDIALVWALVLLAMQGATTFAVWLLVLSVIHQILKTLMLYRLFKVSSPRTAWYAAWYPLAGIVSAWISIDAIRSCLTGRVVWRGTSYAGATRTVAADAVRPS